MSDNISKHCEPCNNGENSTLVNATTYCTTCEESYCESCSTAHRSQKATRSHDLTNIETYFEITQHASPSTVCEPCSENGIRLTAVLRCLNCEESYCENCARIHKSQKATRNHEVTEFETENKRSVCEACSYDGIEDRPASALCKTCDEVFCIDCTKAHKSQKATRRHHIEDHQDTNRQPPVLEKDQTPSTKANCCDHCKDKNRVNVLQDAFWFCFSCRQALCDSCANDHKKAPEASNHRIIHSAEPTQGQEEQANLTANSRKNSVNSLSDESKSTKERKGCHCCDTSDDDEIAGFCSDCKVQLCSACVKEHGQSEDTKTHRLLVNSHEQQNNQAATEKQLLESDHESFRSCSVDSIPDENKGEQKCRGCDNCDMSDDEKITSICLNCKTQLCSACVEIHALSEDTKSHRLIPDIHKQQDDSITNEEQLLEPEVTIESDAGIDSLDSATTGVADLCQSCHGQGIKSAVTAFCFDCLKTLCDECMVKHTEDEATKLHTIMKRNKESQNLNSNKATEENKEEIIYKRLENERDVPSTQPGKPVQVGALKVDSITITWGAPKELFDSYCYQIRYKEHTCDAKWQYYDEDKTQNTTLIVKNLKILETVDPSRATKPKISCENCRPGLIESVHER